MLLQQIVLGLRLRVSFFNQFSCVFCLFCSDLGRIRLAVQRPACGNRNKSSCGGVCCAVAAGMRIIEERITRTQHRMVMENLLLFAVE